MNIKNYTTEVSATKSIENIKNLLMSFGATNIMMEIDSGHITSISFLIKIDNVPFGFKLPGNPQPIYKWLLQKYPRSKKTTLLQRAERIAWKHQYEWLHIQFTSIELSQLEKMQALLPYCYDPVNNKTIYEKLRDGKFQNLLPNGN